MNTIVSTFVTQWHNSIPSSKRIWVQIKYKTFFFFLDKIKYKTLVLTTLTMLLLAPIFAWSNSHVTRDLLSCWEELTLLCHKSQPETRRESNIIHPSNVTYSFLLSPYFYLLNTEVTQSNNNNQKKKKSNKNISLSLSLSLSVKVSYILKQVTHYSWLSQSHIDFTYIQTSTIIILKD